MDHEGSAAGLVCGCDDFAAFGGEDAGGGGVDVGEEDLLDASGEHADAKARGGGGSGVGGMFAGEVCRDYGEERFHCGDAFGCEAEQAGAADEGLQAGSLIEEEWCGENAEAGRVRKCAEEDTAEE